MESRPRVVAGRRASASAGGGPSEPVPANRSRLLSTGPVLGLAAVALALVQGILAVAEAPAWAHVGALVLVAAVAAGGVVRDTRLKAAEEAEAERRELDAVQRAATDRERRLRAALRVWPLPEVADAAPGDLGIRAASASLCDAATGMTRYVSRTSDAAALRSLTRDGLLLLIGEPLSGVTRTAWEVVRSARPRAHVLVPSDIEALVRAVDVEDVLRDVAGPVVLWLDRVERLTGLDPVWLRRLTRDRADVAVVATIATSDYEEWVRRDPGLADLFEPGVPLARYPDDDEVARAAVQYPGVDLTEGVGAAFTSDRALMARARGGWAACPLDPPGSDCAVARVLVTAAIQWRATGTSRPMPPRAAALVAPERVRAGLEADPRHLEAAVAWATTPLPSGRALLASDDAGVLADDRLLQVWRDEGNRPAAAVWASAVDDAAAHHDSDALGRVGFHAFVAGEGDVEAAAWAHATEYDDAAVAWMWRAVDEGSSRRDAAGLGPVLGELLRLCEASPPGSPGARALADVLEVMGRAARDLGQEREALVSLERALALREQEDPTSPAVARTLDALALTHAYLREVDTADRLMRRARAIAALHPGDWSDLLMTEGVIAGARDRRDDALALFQQALEHTRAIDGDQLMQAQLLANIAGGLAHRGRLAEAEEAAREALTIQEQVLGRRHIELTGTLANLAGVLFRRGRLSEAVDVVKRELRIEERHLGARHPRVASARSNLATLHKVQGQYAEALEEQQAALEIHAETLGRSSVEVAIDLTSIGSAYNALGEYALAEEALLEARQILLDLAGERAGGLPGTLRKLAEAQVALNATADALRTLGEALRIVGAQTPRDESEYEDLLGRVWALDPHAQVAPDGTLKSDLLGSGPGPGGPVTDS